MTRTKVYSLKADMLETTWLEPQQCVVLSTRDKQPHGSAVLPYSRRAPPSAAIRHLIDETGAQRRTM